jgi:Helix-turn-helix domain
MRVTKYAASDGLVTNRRRQILSTTPNTSQNAFDQAVAERRHGTLTIEQAAQVLGISRWLAYEEAKSGYLAGVKVLRIGRRLVVPRWALEAMLAGETLGEGRADG